MPRPVHPKAKYFLESELFARLVSFPELEARITALPTTQDRGHAFEVFAEAYLATQAVVQARQVWTFDAIPSQISSLLSLTSRDMGVDGVIETSLGDLNAYQVKFRTNRAALTWDELGTFMGLSDKANQRILFTNSNYLPALMDERTGFFCIRGADLDRLEARDFEAIELWLKSGQVTFQRKLPLPHQDEALAAIMDGLQKHDRITAIMACGSGKTLVELWAAERLGSRSVLVLVPSLALIRQTLHEWLREARWPSLSYLCVCSDLTVVRGADNLVVHQSDLDFPVTTESTVVRRFLERPFDGVRVVFSTYQSARVVAEGMVGQEPFEFGIFDEAHKTAGREGASFGFALSDKNLAIKKRLFLTATPRHYDVRNKDKEGDAKLVYSMDVPEVYGPVAYTLTFAEAARRDIICSYKVLISVVTSDMLTEHLLRHGEVLVEGDVVKARQVASQIAIQKAVEQYGVSRIFTFHRSVASAKSFVAPGGEGIGAHLPQFRTFHVNGEMRTAERDSLMQEFRDASNALVSNARCLTEGVDVPAVDMVAFMSPRKSRVDIVQATGRAMRKSPGKTTGYILVPVYLEQAKGETLEEAVARNDMSDLWDVLQAMRDQDEVLTEVIRTMRVERGLSGDYTARELRERVEVLGPQISLESLRKGIEAQCVDRLGPSWDEYYGQLIKYKEEFGHCSISAKKSTSTNPSLGSWVSAQRQYKKAGKLSTDRIARLDALGFVWDPYDGGWENRFQELSAYKEAHGDCNVPYGWVDDPILAKWVSHQRDARWRRHKLTPEKIARLDALGFSWRPYSGEGSVWEVMFSKLSAYKTEHGHCNIPYGKQDMAKLYRWSIFQRVMKNRGKLDAEKTRQLESLGFEWARPRYGNTSAAVTTWDEMFEKLKAHKAEHGDCRVSHDISNKLYMWANAQRRAKKQGKLSTEKVERLDALGFEWILRNDARKRSSAKD